MDSALVISNASANLVSTKGVVVTNKSSVFLGECTRGSLNNRFCSNIQSCKIPKTRKSKPGLAYAVYTPDINKEFVVMT